MARRKKTRAEDSDEVTELKNRLEETEETLEAIRQYLVDAFVVDRSEGTQIVTVEEAGLPYQKMVEAMNEGAITIIPDGTILYCNPHFCGMVQMGCEQVIGQRIQDLIVPAEQEALDRFLNGTGNEVKSGIRGEFCLRTEKRDCLPVQLSAYQLSMKGVRAISIIATDISERKQAEEALKSSENLFRFIANSSPDIIFSQDLDLKYKWIINPVSPLTPEQVVGKTDEDLLPEDQAKRLTELKMKLLETGESIHTVLLLSPGGSPCWYDTVYQPIFNGNGKITGLIGYARNINESVLAKEKIRSLASALTKAEQVERHRISQILHDDLQQRLFAVKAQLSMLVDGHESNIPPNILSAIEQVQSDLSNTVAITRSLSIDLSPVVLHGEGLADAVAWLSSQMEEQFDLKVEMDAQDTLSFLEDHMRVLLFRAVRELLFNIVKHAHTTHAAVRLEKTDRNARITVSDMGTGFDVESVLNNPKLAHGLLVLKDRLNLVGGSMQVTSKLGEGTCVVIETPLELTPA